ncbi:MAG: cohesin domain-containing protein [Candidatus Aminicenantes bacterium]|jgi:hypothetical protein
MKTVKLPPLWSVLLSLVFLFAFTIYCKKSSTAPEITPPEQELTSLTIDCSPSSGGTDTNFTVVIRINNTDREIKVFGLEMKFDADKLQFRRIEDGELTESWAALDGNEISSGTLRVGGFMGAGDPITQGTTGNIAEVKFKVIGSNFNDGQQSQICIESYTDDIASLTPLPSCANFTLRK